MPLDNKFEERVLRCALLNEKQVAAILNMSVSTLRNNRHNGIGLKYFKIGRRVLYDQPDIEEFLERSRVYTKFP